MASETTISAEDFAALAVNDPEKWVRIFVTRDPEDLNIDLKELAPEDPEDNGLSLSNVGEFDELEPMYGLELIEVSSQGGHEGGGEHAEVTYAIAPEGSKAENGRVPGALAYVEFYGYYASHEGTEWDEEIHVVEPRDVMVVQYFPKQK